MIMKLQRKNDSFSKVAPLKEKSKQQKIKTKQKIPNPKN